MVEVYPKHKFNVNNVNVFVYHANKGEGLPKHEHTYSHVTICHNGSCIIRKANKEKVITKDSGAFNLIPNEWHEIEALEDNTVFENIFLT